MLFFLGNLHVLLVTRRPNHKCASLLMVDQFFFCVRCRGLFITRWLKKFTVFIYHALGLIILLGYVTILKVVESICVDSVLSEI